MLGKLIKYEWKASYKVLSVLNLVLVLITLFGCLLLKATPFTEEGDLFLSVLLIMLYALSMSAFALVTVIYIYFRFYKNLYTAEGYLMHTLPVTPMQLFHSKFLVGYFWVMLNALLNLLSLAALAWASGIFELENVSTELQFLYQYTIGVSPVKFFLLLLAITLSGNLSSVLMGYFSVLLGQLVEKYKLGAAIGFYFALYFGSQILASLLVAIPNTVSALSDSRRFYGEFGSYFYGNMLMWLFLSQFVFGCIFYAACLLLMRRRVNLD